MPRARARAARGSWLRVRADDLLGLRAVAEEDHRRDRQHLVGGRGLLVVVDVELDDPQVVALGGDLLEHRADDAARAAPRRPEVDERGRLGLDDLGLEVAVGDLCEPAPCVDSLKVGAHPLYKVKHSVPWTSTPYPASARSTSGAEVDLDERRRRRAPARRAGRSRRSPPAARASRRARLAMIHAASGRNSARARAARAAAGRRSSSARRDAASWAASVLVAVAEHERPA